MRAAVILTYITTFRDLSLCFDKESPLRALLTEGELPRYHLSYGNIPYLFEL